MHWASASREVKGWTLNCKDEWFKKLVSTTTFVLIIWVGVLFRELFNCLPIALLKMIDLRLIRPLSVFSSPCSVSVFLTVSWLLPCPLSSLILILSWQSFWSSVNCPLVTAARCPSNSAEVRLISFIMSCRPSRSGQPWQFSLWSRLL